MFKPEQVGKRTRYTYAKINEVIKMPHLLDIQRKSYEWFLAVSYTHLDVYKRQGMLCATHQG